MSNTIWHPYTQMKTAGPALKVRSGKGAYLELENKEQVLDLISSWWTNLHGHCHPYIVDAMHRQAQTLEHVIFAGFTHEPAERLAERLVGLLPDGLEHIFFSDDGSTAVEVALKMARQYWFNIGEDRKKFIAFEGGYHGDTFGAMAIGASSGFFDGQAASVCEVDFVGFPYIGGTNLPESETRSLRELEQLLIDGAETYAALIMEPLVQGAAGMRMCSIGFVRETVRLCKEYGILVIFDEVMTGFGRTGDWFAATKSRTFPDIICLSKGITGGFLPLAVTAANDAVYESFLSVEPRKMLAHGHSYTANPIACAAALASLDLLEENESSFQRLSLLHQFLSDSYWKNFSGLENVRVCGTIAAADLSGFGQNSYFNEVSIELRERFLREGMLVRPLGKTIYFMPPYCVGDEALELAYRTTCDIVNELKKSNKGVFNDNRDRASQLR